MSRVRSRKLTFIGSQGRKLVGSLELPTEDEAHAYGIYAHCFTCSRSLRAAGRICRGLAAQGIAMLRFDFAGIGDSEGEFIDTSFASNIEDLQAAATFLQTEWQAPSLMVGHSMGGAAAIQAASSMASVKAVVTLAAPAQPNHILSHFTSIRQRVAADQVVEVEIGGKRYSITQAFIDTVDAMPADASIRGLDKALLVLHSPLDETVDASNAAEIFTLARHPKSFISLDKANHLLTNPDDADYVARLIATWVQPYLSESSQ